MFYNPKYNCPTSPPWISPYENVEYYNTNTTVIKTRDFIVYLPSSMLYKMTEEVYSFSPGLLKPASLLVFYFVGVLAEIVKMMKV